MEHPGERGPCRQKGTDWWHNPLVLPWLSFPIWMRIERCPAFMGHHGNCCGCCENCTGNCEKYNNRTNSCGESSGSGSRGQSASVHEYVGQLQAEEIQWEDATEWQDSVLSFYSPNWTWELGYTQNYTDIWWHLKPIYAFFSLSHWILDAFLKVIENLSKRNGPFCFNVWIIFW